MIKVSKQDFYDMINPQDICVSSRLTPYSSFTKRSGVEVGRAVDVYDGDGERVYNEDCTQQLREYFVHEWFYEKYKYLIGTKTDELVL